MHQSAVYEHPVARVMTRVKRVLLFALLWWLLTEGRAEAWGMGVVLVVVAALLSVSLAPPVAWSLPGALRFVPYFIWRSLAGGVDVARRALSPARPLQPAVIEYSLRLSLPRSRLFMAGIISLLPGTLCTEIRDDKLWVHILDRRGDFQRDLGILEQKVAGLFRDENRPEAG